MTFDNIKKELKNKIYHPVYFLMGEEPFYIDYLAGYIEKNVLTESEKEFNQSVLYGKDTDCKTIVSSAGRYPMMSNYQVVIVKEAQAMERFEDKITEYLGYFEKPQKSTILVICYKYKKLDTRKKIAKAIQKNGILFESKKIYDSKIPGWISNHVKEKGYAIEPVATQLLSDYLGNDLSKIVNETEKLFISLEKGAKITPALIEENIGISKDYNVFEFQKALGQKDVTKANRIALYFAANQKEHSIVFILAMLYNFFSKIMIFHFLKDRSERNAASALSISPYFLKDYKEAAKNYPANSVVNVFSYLREYDVKAKGIGNVSANHGELLKELTFKLIHRV